MMSGLGFDNKMPRVISARKHAAIDYIHSATNLAVSAWFRKDNKRAANCALILGASVLVNALMTDYPLGVFRVWNFKVHGMLDYGVAVTSALMPTLLGFRDEPEAAYFHMQGVGESLIAGITNYDDTTGSRRSRRRYDEEVQRYIAA